MKKWPRTVLMALSFLIVAVVGVISIIRFSSSPKPASQMPAFAEPETPSMIQQELNSIVSGLPIGQIEYNPPLRMKQYRKERIEVRISQSLHVDIVKGLKGRGLPIIEDIPVSSFMKATLTGDDFKIAALSETVQPVLSSGFAQWEWNVTPRRAGARELNLSVAAVFKTSFGEAVKSNPVMDKTIIVDIGFPPIEMILKYAGVIVALVGGIIGIIKYIESKKKKSKTIVAADGN